MSGGRGATSYLAALAAGLAAETAGWCVEMVEAREIRRDAERLRDALLASAHPTELAVWQLHWNCYRSLVHRKAAALNRVTSIARSYPSMDNLWADAAAEEKGESPDAFWDVYENGLRRRCERRLAGAYGTEAALLLNCGMSALAVALGAAGLRPGSVLLAPSNSYFETAELLETTLGPAGIQVLRVPVHEPGALLLALREHRPHAVLLESVTNGPELEVPLDIDRCHEAANGTVFIIDNSVQSHLCPWFALAPALAPQLLVVESAVKYLTHECMAGVIYGGSALLAKARRVARVTGQQLQQRALSFLCTAEADHAVDRLALHSRNVRRFVAELMPAGASLFEYVRPLDGNGAGSAVFANGVGALVFSQLRRWAAEESPEETARRHRELLQHWQAKCQAAGCDLPVRCGFGWSETAARVYESRALNRSDAPTYLRVTVGIEPEYVVGTLARALLEAAREVTAAQECYAGRS